MAGFWQGKSVLVTGHTGFKGSWLSLWLSELGAKVSGIALDPETDPSLFEQLHLADRVNHKIGDIRSYETVRQTVIEAEPDLLFHLAAQPLVLASYEAPLTNWDTNVMGTAHVLQALREVAKPCAAVMITTDKVYENREWIYPYREADRLGGHDPYSASKAACELLIASWRKSFFGDLKVRVATARAGNVIGGGDWAANRILPDLARALSEGKTLTVRNPGSSRPWQHVLEPLSGYMLLAEALYEGVKLSDSYNFGPESSDVRPVRELVNTALGSWPGNWEDASQSGAPHEAGLLSLGIERARDELGYAPRWNFERSVRETMLWYKAASEGRDVLPVTLAQIRDFEVSG